MTKKEKDNYIKELKKATKTWEYWCKREQGFSYSCWPNNVYIDDKRMCAHGLIEHYAELLNIDYSDWLIGNIKECDI